ncbi:MAG: sulfurtransferase [Chloroflexi bacterium]|nr:MAG: sulfurtransferase [Chloroflexota bacterium]
MTFGPLVDAGWLRTHMNDGNVAVIDFRWHLLGPKGHDQYLGGHIPGAVFVDLEAVSGREGPGRHPLPSPEQFQAQMRAAGVTSETKVVVYDDEGGSAAARLWFLLGWFGHDDQAVLDGGIQAWGSPLETDFPHTVPGDFTAREPDRSRVLDFEAVSRLGDLPLLDARAGERYRGEAEPVDPKAGHIPGALSAPWQENLAPGGKFKSPQELRQRFEGLGAEQGAVSYCGSGVTACHNVLAMRLAGLPDALLYEGSWSDWSHRDAPVATGAEPG